MDGTKECEIFVRKFHPAKLVYTSEAGLCVSLYSDWFFTWNFTVFSCSWFLAFVCAYDLASERNESLLPIPSERWSNRILARKFDYQTELH